VHSVFDTPFFHVLYIYGDPNALRGVRYYFRPPESRRASENSHIARDSTFAEQGCSFRRDRGDDLPQHVDDPVDISALSADGRDSHMTYAEVHILPCA